MPTLLRKLMSSLFAVLLLAHFAAGQIPQSYFGLTVNHAVTTNWPTVDFGTLRIYDNGASWSTLNPAPGTYNWGPLDQWLNLASAHGADVLYTFGRTPKWAISGTCTGGYAPYGCAQPPASLQYWDDFVSALATHAAGRIKYWEMWNEPNETAVSWAGGIPTLVTMTQHAHSIIKSIDHNAIIVSPGTDKNSATVTYCNQVLGLSCGSNWMAAYLAAGAKGYVDVIAFHGYLGPIPENIIGAIQLHKAVMAAEGVGTLPLWDTETSWEQNTQVTGTSERVAFLARKFLLERSFGISRLYWNAWDSTTMGTLWASTTGVQPAGIAYGQVSKWLAGATLSSPCAMSADSTWICVITRAGYEAEIIWNSATSKSYFFPSQFRQYRTLAGSVQQLSGTSVTIGAVPILLETTAAGPIALLSVTPTAGPKGVQVTADASASYDSTANIVGRSIIWGDGTYGNWLEQATHSYSKAGTYKLTLKLTDSAGQSSEMIRSIAVDGGPIPVLAVSTTSGPAPLTVLADSSKSSDYPGQITGRSTYWGDGTHTNWVATTPHVYTRAGTFVITVYLTNNYGQKSQTSRTITVK